MSAAVRPRRAVTDANANNLASCAQNATYPNGSFLTYSPFGTPMDCTQSATAYMFTSKEQDVESSLDHFRYRKYAPLTARWLTPDPAALAAATAPPTANATAAPTCPTCACGATSPAPGFGVPFGAARLPDPQSWNGYLYAASSPQRFVDPTGLFLEAPGGLMPCWCILLTQSTAGHFTLCNYLCECTVPSRGPRHL